MGRGVGGFRASFEVPDDTDGKALIQRLKRVPAIEFVELQVGRRLIQPIHSRPRD